MIHHSPQWYHNHCKSENANPLLRKQLKRDCAFIGADYDPTHKHIEHIPAYEEQWNLILRSHDWTWETTKAKMMDVVTREAEPDRKRHERQMRKEQKLAQENYSPPPSSEEIAAASGRPEYPIPSNLGPCPAGGAAKFAWLRARRDNAISALAVDDFTTTTIKATRKPRIAHTKSSMTNNSLPLPNDITSLEAVIADAQKKIDQIKALDGYRTKHDNLAKEAGYSDTKEFLIALGYNLVIEKKSKPQASATGASTKKKGKVGADEIAKMKALYADGNGMSIADIAKKQNRNEEPVRKALGVKV